MDENNKLIRNSTAEFLIFTQQAGEDGIEVRYEDETIWLSQKLIATLFDVNIRTINEHLKNIYKQNELSEKATIRKFRIVQPEGKREVTRNIEYYNLDAIISVGYRVNSFRAKRHIPVTMEDWAKKLDAFLQFNERDILKNSGKVKAKVARNFAESEFEKYRIVQDRLFESDFDKDLQKQLEELKTFEDDEKKS
ncbi:MAG: virulence RhuM family protein [Desulfobacula sp.]|nr:virulence RhuM family protein [Desulfobacula sp.]